MNQEQLNAIKERVAKATPGPWVIEESRFGSFNAASVDENYDLPACLMKANDADFVTNARGDVPALIAEVERLKIELDATCVANKTLKSEKEALEFQLKVSIGHAEELDEELEAEVAENEQLREALEFYAKNSNYLIEWSDKCDEYMPSVADNDGGEIARQALGSEAN